MKMDPQQKNCKMLQNINKKLKVQLKIWESASRRTAQMIYRLFREQNVEKCGNTSFAGLLYRLALRSNVS
jgi:hypothetical protein